MLLSFIICFLVRSIMKINCNAMLSGIFFIFFSSFHVRKINFRFFFGQQVSLLLKMHINVVLLFFLTFFFAFGSLLCFCVNGKHNKLIKNEVHKFYVTLVHFQIAMIYWCVQCKGKIEGNESIYWSRSEDGKRKKEAEWKAVRRKGNNSSDKKFLVEMDRQTENSFWQLWTCFVAPVNLIKVSIQCFIVKMIIFDWILWINLFRKEFLRILIQV